MESQMKYQHSAVDIVKYYGILKKRYKMIVAIVMAITIFAVVYSLTATKMYNSQAVIMPIQQGGGGGKLSSMLGNMTGLMSLAGISNNETQNMRRLMVLLKSRTLAEEIVRKYDLVNVLLGGDGKTYDTESISNETMERAVLALKGSVNFINNRKQSTITISVTRDDPKLSAKVANAYLEELRGFINDNALTVAKRNRLFIEGQLAQNKMDLLDTGKELSEFYSTKGISGVESTVDVPIDINIVTQEGDGVLAGAVDGPGGALEKLGAKKEALEQKIRSVKISVPHQVYLQYIKLREVLLGKINMLLTQQYEMAKIEESRDELAFQTIDPARVPAFRCAPKRKAIVMTSFLTSVVFAVFLVFILEYIKDIRMMTKKSG